MKILLLSFYYTPDLCAGSFRTAALVCALLEQLPEESHIEVITTLPNRYCSYSSEALAVETHEKITIRRVKLPGHKSGMIDQAKSFITYAKNVLLITRNENYQLVFGTSSRLMTAMLSACIARKNNIPLYLDIRDIFVDTITDVLPKVTAFAIKPLLSIIERWTMNQATIINLVSGGFREYFQEKYPFKKIRFFTNGIDCEFLGVSTPICKEIEAKNGLFEPSLQKKACVTVLYAGNMGEGQGLHAIIPQLAERLAGKIRFRLIGDGGRKIHLEKRLAELNCQNVEILPPVKRDQLLVEYQKADVLFLHLNNYDAFKKVLPSKIFEYAALGKPIWAGVAGYAATFIKTEIENSAVFHPCDVEDGAKCFLDLKICSVHRSDFINKYSRKNIMRAMATDILSGFPAGN